MTFTPASALTANTTYAVAYNAALTDSVGNALVNPGSFTFTTGAAADSTGPTWVSWNPRNNETTGRQPSIIAIFNEPLDPINTFNVIYVYNRVTGVYLPGVTGALSTDRKTLTLTLPGPLDPSTNYSWDLYAYDRAGNYTYGGDSFTTSAAIDTTAPSVTSVSPPSSASGVAVNAPIQVRFNENIDATSVAGAISLSPTVAGAAVLGSDNVTVTFTPAANLAVNTTYTVNVGGVRDVSGNAMAPYSSTFTTSASATADTTAGTITMLPANSAANVAVNASVVLTLSKAVNPLSVNTQSFKVYDQTVAKYVAGSYSVGADYKSITFTPSPAYGANHTICVYASWSAGIDALNDWGGNKFTQIYGQCFTTAATADTTAPTVAAVAPFASATGIGPNNPVTVTFSKPMNPTTLNGQNAAVYNGSALFTSSYSVSADGTSITFSTGNLPWSTTFTIVVTPNVTDLAGNHLAAQYTSTFTTMAQPVTTRPSVTVFRPGAGATGVSPNTLLTFFLTQSINASTAASAMHISQNGALITGSVAVTDNNQVVTFTPSGALTPGAQVGVWFTSAAADNAGNALVDYQTTFTVAPDLSTTAPQLTSFSPQCCSQVPVNSVVDAKFNKAIDPTTVNSGTFYVMTPSNTPVSGTISLLNGNTLLRFTPSSPFAANTAYFSAYLTTGIKDTNGLALASLQQRSFQTNAVSDTAPLTVSAVAPTNGSTSIGVNALIRVTFSKPVEVGTVSPATLSLSAGGAAIPYTYSYDGTSTITMTPQQPLPASSSITVGVTNGLTDYSGNAAAPATATFTTAAGSNFSAPSVISSTVDNGITNVPVASVFTLTFDRPMDTRTLNSRKFQLQDTYSGYINVPGAISYSADGTQATFAPSSILAVNRQYRVYMCNAYDLTGNYAYCYFTTFTTSLNAPAAGPQVTLTMPLDNMTAIPDNFQPEVKFDRTINAASLGGISLTANGAAVPFTFSLSNGNTIVKVVPNSILQPNTAYVLSVSGVKDAAGAAMPSPATIHFTTGPSIDLTAPVVVSASPNGNTATNPVIRWVFSERMDPVRAPCAYIYNYVTGTYLPGIGVSVSSDWQSLTFTYSGTLSPNTRFQASLCSAYDLAGNQVNPGVLSFTTGSGADTTAPSVVSSTPPSGATAVPLNATIALKLSKQIDPTTIGASSLTLTPSVAGTPTLSPDGLTLTFTNSSNLAANTAYTVNASGFRDVDGNLVTPFSSSFTTGAATDTVHGTISLGSPGVGATGVSVNTAITVNLSEAVNPSSVTPDTFAVFARVNGSDLRTSGAISIGASGTTLTFTPASPLPANTLISVYVGYYANLYDLGGNNFSSPYNAQFTTAAVSDTTPPQVTSVSPANNASSVGPNAVVTLVFSKAIDPATINPANFALYNGYTNLNAWVSHSSDNSTVTLSTTLPFNSTITVSVSTGIRDLSGNYLATAFRSTFTTIPQPLTVTPSITQMRPANGATGVPANAPITLYTSAPVNAGTATGALAVSQNGALISGSTTVSSDGRSIVFTPGVTLAAGATIQVFLTNSATDTYGNPFSSYSGAFTVAPDLSATAPVVVNHYPACCSGVPTNSIFEVQFSKPIAAASVSSATFYLKDPSNNTVPAAISQPWPNVLRLVPNSPLTAGAAYYYLSVTTGLQDTNGLPLQSQNFSVAAGSSADTSLPAVTTVAPTNGATGVGDNATVRFAFNKLMDTDSINSSTVTLMSGGTAVPFSLSLGGSASTTVTLTPQAPLPHNAAVTLTLGSGVVDLQGHAIPQQTITFNTTNGADFSGPQIVYETLDGSVTSGIPVNTAFSWTFNKPIDQASVNSSQFSLYDYSLGYRAPNLSLSADGRTVTMVPTANLSAGVQHEVCAYGLDLNGNSASRQCVYFTTASASDTTAPQVTYTNPVNGATAAATNSLIEVTFNEPIQSGSISQATLTTGGNPVPFTGSLVNGQTTIRLTPSVLLQANTLYTVTITGAKDIAGNTMAGTYTYSFTTGANPMLAGPTFGSATVLVGGVQTPLTSGGTVNNVQTNSPITVNFSSAIDPNSILAGGVKILLTSTSAAVPFTFTMSSDAKTVTITPSAAFSSATSYTIWVDYYSAVRDQAGNTESDGGRYFYIVTQ